MQRLITRSPRLANAILTPGVPLLAATIVTLLVVVAAVLPAMASAKPVQSRVQLDAFGLVYRDGSYDYVFAGVVSAPLRGWACLGGRNLRVYRNAPQGPDTLVGARRTDAIGMGLVTVHDPDMAELVGEYYAKVGDARKKSRGRSLNCLGSRSSEIAVGAPQFHRAGRGRQARADLARSRIDD